uniref:Masculinizer n=1 Tax=Bicyclus anynana TaxID=110368 RepID=A0AAT9URT4_BICAN
MSNKAGTNGGQPPIPGQPAARNEGDVTNTDNAEKQKDFCRDFIWGQCNKGAQCKYRHELVFEVMKKTLKFCHDFQNSSGCTRELCTYLHASKDEQSLFKATGQLPQVLLQRHANMSAASGAETIPQIALYIQESLAGPPPPPPPPPLPVTNPVAVSIAPLAPGPVYPRPHMTIAPMAPRPAPMMPIQQPPPPPPPTTAQSTPVRQRAPVFTVSAQPAYPPANPGYSMPQPPPPVIPLYDASKPPPPLMAMHSQQASGTSKRRPDDETITAPPNKVKKGEEAKTADLLCEQCVQRELRIEALRKQLDGISEEEEYETLMYRKKFDEYEQLKEILKSLISTDLFQKFIQDNVEGTPQNTFQNLFTQSAFSTGVSTVPNHFLLQLMDYVMTDSRGVDLTPTQSQPFDETFIQALSSLPRKPNPVKIIYNNHNHNNSNSNNSTNNAPPEVLQTLVDILRQYNASDKSPPPESNPDINKNATTSNSTINGSQHYSNRQEAPAPVTVTVNSNHMFPSQPGTGVPGVSNAQVFAPQAPSAPPPYQPYQPMPPTGHYYPPPYTPMGMPAAHDIHTTKPHVPVTLAPAPPPPAPLAPTPLAPAAPPAPAPLHQPTHYTMGRYPPPYYRHQ